MAELIAKLADGRLAINVSELQQVFGLSRAVCYELAKRPDFPTLRINKRILVPIKELLEWIEKNVNIKEESQK